MIQIRNNTFETNSSSSHSLVITKNAKEWLTPEECLDDLWIYFDTETGIYSPPDYLDDLFEFNRYPFKVLDSFKQKLMFLYANVPSRYYGKDKDGYSKWRHDYYKISNVVKAFIPEYKRVKFDGDRPSCEAYNVLATIQQHMTLEEFLRNPNIIVICDGDEYNIWKDLKKIGLIDTRGIEKEIKFPGG